MPKRPSFLVTIELACAFLFLLPGPATISAGDPRFDKLVDDYFAARFEFRPSEGTAAGLHEYDHRLEDLSQERAVRRIEELVQSKARLFALKRSQGRPTATLPADDLIDLTFLERQIDAELIDLNVLKEWKRNPMLYTGLPGGAVDVVIKRDFAPPADRLRAVISREKGIPAVLEAARQNLVQPPREFTDLAIRMAKGSLGFFEGAVANWAEGAAGTNTKLLAEFHARNARVIAAFRAYATWLETDLKPRSNGRYAIGKDLFLAKLKTEEMVEVPLDELLAKGEANLEKDYKAFVATARLIDPKKTPAEVMKSLSDDHPTAEDLIPSVRRSVEEARRYLVDKGIVTVPSEVRPLIEETPPYARSGSFASMDTPGPYETRATQAFYYVTPVEKDWDTKHVEEHLRLYNPPVVAMINVHEAYPGHYLQFLYARQVPDQGPEAALLRDQRRGLGPLLRADDGRRRIRRRRPQGPAGPASRGPLARLPLRRRHQAAHRGLDGRAGGQALCRQGLSRTGQRLRRSATGVV